MSSFHRQNLYSDATPDDNMDFSGFLGNLPTTEPPKVTPRPRQQANSNASGTMGDLRYTMPNPLSNSEPDDPPIYHALSPFWADGDGIAPKAAAISKTIGATGMVLAGTYAAAKRRDGGSPYAKAAFIGSSALYVHPVLGLNHGMLKVIPGRDHWVAKYPRYGGIGAIHLLGAYGFYKLIRRQVYA